MKSSLRRKAVAVPWFIWLCFFSVSEGSAQNSISFARSVAAVSTDSTPQGLVEKDVVVFGTKIHYAESGTGPTVVLLHGLGGNLQNWALNIAPLAAKFHVVIPDQVGFGKSDKPLINYRIGTYVDFLNQFCKQLKIERATLVGESMGGWIAAAYTLAFPEQVDRLVLVDAAGYAPPADFDHNTLYGLNPSTREGMKQLTGKVFYSKLFSSVAVIDQVLTQRISAGDGYTINSIVASIIRGEDFLDKRVQGIKQPTLIMWGRQDGLLSLTDGERFKKEIPNSTLIVFEQCGHVPPFEKAVEFNTALLKFLAP